MLLAVGRTRKPHPNRRTFLRQRPPVRTKAAYPGGVESHPRDSSGSPSRSAAMIAAHQGAPMRHNQEQAAFATRAGRPGRKPNGR